MKEVEWQQKVIETCNWLNLRVYHTYDSRRSNAGYPDLTIVGPRGVIFAELKTDKGKMSPQQEAWIGELGNAGQQAYVWRPSDFDRVLRQLKSIARRTV